MRVVDFGDLKALRTEDLCVSSASTPEVKQYDIDFAAYRVAEEVGAPVLAMDNMEAALKETEWAPSWATAVATVLQGKLAGVHAGEASAPEL